MTDMYKLTVFDMARSVHAQWLAMLRYHGVRSCKHGHNTCFQLVRGFAGLVTEETLLLVAPIKTRFTAIQSDERNEVHPVCNGFFLRGA